MLTRTGDVARQFDETECTIRYWCDEFGVPVKRHNGQRSFDADSITALSEVRRLLRIEGYTIAGAKRKLGIK